MTFASNTGPDPDRLSATARSMLALRRAVFEEWERRLRTSVAEAAALAPPILINTFPTLYDNLVQAIAPDHPRDSLGGGSTVASEHGGERARLTHYGAPTVIAEYQILRAALFDVLSANAVHPSEAESRSIHEFFDLAVRQAVNGYALVQSALRERFIAALTHDLRNPLAVATAATELIRRSTDYERIHDLSTRVSDSLQRMDRMLQEMLDTLVFHAGERLTLDISTFDMMDVVEEVRQTSVAVHGDRMQTQGESVVGWWGREAVKRALENLVSNACKYGAPGTPIRITVRAYTGRVLIAVHNHGEPIPAGQIEDIFQAFRRADAARNSDKPGWGIGLPYVRSVAESHGGSVGVDSLPELGTTFVIDMPIDARPYRDAPTLEGAGPRHAA